MSIDATLKRRIAIFPARKPSRASRANSFPRDRCANRVHIYISHICAYTWKGRRRKGQNFEFHPRGTVTFLSRIFDSCDDVFSHHFSFSPKLLQEALITLNICTSVLFSREVLHECLFARKFSQKSSSTNLLALSEEEMRDAFVNDVNWKSTSDGLLLVSFAIPRSNRIKVD